VSILVRALLVLLVVAAAALPATAQSRGHGSIYYSPATQRIGWAKSLADDSAADHVASAFCRGGRIDSDSLQTFSTGQGGASATGAGPSIDVVASDCSKVYKFDSDDNHQCAGFGFNGNGGYSKGSRESDRAKVLSDLSSWPETFVICNDDQSVSGIQSFANALGDLARALHGGGSTTDTPSTKLATAPIAPPVSPSGSNAIVFSNGTPISLAYGVKCTNEAAFHTFTIASLASQSIDAASWGISCPSYNVQLATPPAADGSSTTVNKTLSPGGPYQIIFNAQTGAYDITTAPAGVTIVNDVSEPVNFTLGCPSAAGSTYTLAAGQSQTFTAPCPGETLTVSTGTNASNVSKTFPLTSGRTYHLQSDPNTSIITLVAS
jgi:hypothetical protein